MATRGVNGAASGTLNERFIKCEGCRVNVPKEDMLALGQCSVCARPYAPEATADGRGVQVATVAFDGVGAAPAEEKKPRRKRWAVLTSKRGRTYYHNTETGEDRWDTPADLDADAAEDAFVPFKNDAVKKAVLREQMKLEATKMGVPAEVVAATQQQLQHEAEADDPFAKMVNRGAKPAAKGKAGSPEQKKVVAPPAAAPRAVREDDEEDEEEEEEEEQHSAQDASKAGGSCAVM
ncbi:Zinc ion binding protein [Phytophthora cinnamomi]|uniref:Zinc ion binding protein n=1 Tax=Phytophthora cinnamomi TaxID=4785 RepID=UPI00355946BB|nr:Zinc ion binding protein [Phytophthora cinnamomi]